MGVDWEKQPRNPKTGRWELDDEHQRRDCWLRLRLTEAERLAIQTDANYLDMTITGYILAAIEQFKLQFRRAKERKPVEKTHQQRLYERRRQRRQGWP